MRISDWSSDVCSSDLDEGADAGDEQAHGDGQGIDVEPHVDLPAADGEPLEERLAEDPLLLRAVEQAGEDGHGGAEGAGHHRGGQPAGAGLAEEAAAEDQQQEPSQGQGRGEPDAVEELHGSAYTLRRDRSSAEIGTTVCMERWGQ